MIDDQELTRRVADSLRAYAETVDLRPQTFDPTHRMTDVVNLDTDAVPTAATRFPGRRAARSQARLVAAVAATALALAGVTAWVAQGGGEGTGSTELVTLSAPVAPTDGLAPTWVPQGWEVSGVHWSTATTSTSTFGPLLPVDWEAYGARAQLFGDPSDPGVALLIESAGGVLPEDVGDQITVRGHSGYVVPSTERAIVGPTRSDVVVVTWTEGGTELRASFRGLSRDEALAALDRLQARAGGPTAGFEAPPAGGRSLTLLGEAAPSPTPATQVSTSYQAAASPSSGDGPTLLVDTLAATGQTTVPYLNTWLYGERTADGTATVWDPTTSTRTVVRPDGQAVRAELFSLDEADSVVPAGEIEGVGSAEQVTGQSAAGVAPVTPDQLAGWWDAVNDRQASLPLMARVELPTATIEVRGDDSTQALCYQASAETVCIPVPVDDLEGNLSAGMRIDGTDHVVAASPNEAPEIVAFGDDGPYPVEAETGSDGDWHVALAPAPDDGHAVYWDVSAELGQCLATMEPGDAGQVDEALQGDGGVLLLIECYEASS